MAEWHAKDIREKKQARLKELIKNKVPLNKRTI
jgi:hypothetical protein